MNWLVVAAVSLLVYGGLFLSFLRHRHWTARALAVGCVNMLVVGLHLVAPVRGWLDPEYAGYSFGLFRADPGPMVTLIAGAVLVASLASACLAVRNRPGSGMRFVAVVDAILAANVAVVLVGALATDPAGLRIRLGEYLTIPALPAFLILTALMALPLAASAAWAWRRRQPDDR